MPTSTAHATGTFNVTSWDEKPWAEVEGAPKLTHASSTSSYHGDIEGEGVAESLMFYSTGRPADGHAATASYFGYERILGRLGERTGSFVLKAVGTHEDGVATTNWSVVPGSATGELSGLRGEGGFAASAMEVSYSLDYYFET